MEWVSIIIIIIIIITNKYNSRNVTAVKCSRQCPLVLLVRYAVSNMTHWEVKASVGKGTALSVCECAAGERSWALGPNFEFTLRWGGCDLAVIWKLIWGLEAWRPRSTVWIVGANSTFVLGLGKTTEDLGRSTEISDVHYLPASNPVFKYTNRSCSCTVQRLLCPCVCVCVCVC